MEVANFSLHSVHSVVSSGSLYFSGSLSCDGSVVVVVIVVVVVVVVVVVLSLHLEASAAHLL